MTNTFTKRTIISLTVLSLMVILAPIVAIVQGATVEHQVNIEPLNKDAPVKVAAILYGKRTYANPLGPHQLVMREGG